MGDSEVKVSPSLEPGRVRLSVRIGGRGLVLTPSAEMARWIARCLVRMAEKAEGAAEERAYPNGDEYADGHVAGFRDMADRIERGDV